MTDAKAGHRREAILYTALDGAGAGDGRSVQELREAARRAFDEQELPVWRRSGFWTTSLEYARPRRARRRLCERGAGRRRFARCPRPARPDDRPERRLDGPRRTRPWPGRAGRDPLPLEQALSRHAELAAPWFAKRLPIDRNKLEAANAAFWTDGIFLYVPPNVQIKDPFELVYAIDARASPSTGGHWSSAGPGRVPRPRVRARRGFRRTVAACRRVRALPRRTAPAAASPNTRTGARRGLRRLDATGERRP